MFCGDETAILEDHRQPREPIAVGVAAQRRDAKKRNQRCTERNPGLRRDGRRGRRRIFSCAAGSGSGRACPRADLGAVRDTAVSSGMKSRRPCDLSGPRRSCGCTFAIAWGSFERSTRQKLQPQIETLCLRPGNSPFTLTGPRSAGQSRNRCLPWLPCVPRLPTPSPGKVSRVPGGPCRRRGWVSYPPLSVFLSTRFSSETASPR